MIVMLVGPIDYWWNQNWHTKAHLEYMMWRKHINDKLVEAGHLVYRPHEAFKGAWDERAQKVNDLAVNLAGCLVNLTPPGIPAHGTAAEIRKAQEIGTRIYNAPPSDFSEISDLIVAAVNPYARVPRRT